MRDRTAFTFGALALALAAVALWQVYGEIDWKTVLKGTPALLILIAVGVLFLSRRRH